MSIIDLNNRITADWQKYNAYKKSANSLIYVQGKVNLDSSGPTSLILTVGSQYYDCSKRKYFQISEKGLRVKPGKSVLIETKEILAMPYNVFGAIYGIGKNIFKGGFLSNGKINPGFHDHLKLGYYNGSDTDIIFNPNDILACCSFFDVEITIVNELETYLTNPEPELESSSFANKLKQFLVNNWYSCLSLIVAILAVLIAALK